MKIEQLTADGDLVRVWDSQQQIVDEFGADSSHLSKVLNGKRQTHKGFQWQRIEEETEEEDALEFDDEETSEFTPTRADDIRHDPMFQEFLEFRRGKIDKIQFTPGVHFVYGCIHMPFHNKAFFDASLELAEDLKDQLVGLQLIGDILDMNSLSGHERGKVPMDGITLEYEYEESNKELDKLDQAFAGVKEKNFLYGNHEDRYLRHMKDVNNAKYGGALISPLKGVSLENRGYRVQTDWKNGRVYLGRYLELCHGEFLNIHTAKKHIDIYRTSIMFAHTHRIQSYIEGNCGGFNIGWMGDATSGAFNYASRGQKDKWNNGFAVVHVDEDGYYYVQQIVWQNNKFCYNGKIYK